jgi:hypothetical protein
VFRPEQREKAMKSFGILKFYAVVPGRVHYGLKGGELAVLTEFDATPGLLRGDLEPLETALARKLYYPLKDAAWQYVDVAREEASAQAVLNQLADAHERTRTKDLAPLSAGGDSEQWGPEMRELHRKAFQM